MRKPSRCPNCRRRLLPVVSTWRNRAYRTWVSQVDEHTLCSCGLKVGHRGGCLPEAA